MYEWIDSKWVVQWELGYNGEDDYENRGTNNIGEYEGLILGLKKVAGYQDRHITIEGDSQLVIRQCKGEWNCSSNSIAYLYDEARHKLRGLERQNYVRLKWVPRDENECADALAEEAWRSGSFSRFVGNSNNNANYYSSSDSSSSSSDDY